MSAPAPAARVSAVRHFELDLRTGELRKHGAKLRLQGQPLQLLGILLQGAGNLVTRENSGRKSGRPTLCLISTTASQRNWAYSRKRWVIRGDTALYFETLPRRDYRFIAPVEEVQGTPGFLRRGFREANGNKTR